MSEQSGKVALITGASRGIGAAAARELAKAGMAVGCAARSPGEIEAVAADITAAGGKAIAIACDVSDFSAVESAVARCREAFGGIDLLVNNAGVIEPIARLADSDPAGWAQAVDINLKGVYYGMRAAAPHMIAAGGGTIVNISSGAATSVLEGWSHYCATKAAVLSLTKAGHLELGDHGVRVVGLSPGTVATEMQVQIKASGINPVSQLDPSAHIPPEWVGRAIVWLANAGPDADPFLGDDFKLRDEENRKRVGLG